MINTQAKQVIEVMRQNGGYATFGQLNSLLDFSTWKTKTPQASIRRIVQECNDIFRIRPGLWALREFENSLPEQIQFKTKDKKVEEIFTHSYYQGLIVEIGNMKRLQTYVPLQDKNRMFLEKPLKELVTNDKIYDFTYPEILRRATTIDVIWFNERNLPNSFFEVEHSTDIQNSVSKYFELQDYYAEFYIVAPEYRKRKFDDIMSQTMFKPIKNRVKFVDYENIGNQYSKMFELSQVKQLI
ncbi:hypothetical protein FACS189426_17800 [Bacteroidia bacterium]|nr:hypothetical protein FACS189426_17800 [Bacteroidia bacterium]